jgi:hypothetical protein
MPNKDGYIGHLVTLSDGRYARIIQGVGKPSSANHKIRMIDLDGSTFECYHDKIQYVWNP